MAIAVTNRPGTNVTRGFWRAFDIRAVLRSIGYSACLFAVSPAVVQCLSARDRTVVLPLGLGDATSPCLRRSLDMAGIRLLGSPTNAFALSRDKNLTCCVLERAGIRTTKGITVSSQNYRWPGRFPAVVKPAVGGGSEGIACVPTATALARCVSRWFKDSKRPLRIEEYETGREFTVWVIDQSQGKRSLSIIEIDTPGLLLKSSSKDTDTLQKHSNRTPLLTNGERHRIEEVCSATHDAVGAFGYSRVDLLLTSEGPIVIEINTAPTIQVDDPIGFHSSTGPGLEGFFQDQIRQAFL